jgi:hypothetical protein
MRGRDREGASLKSNHQDASEMVRLDKIEFEICKLPTLITSSVPP